MNVFITGGAKGIGRGIAEAFAADGANVIIGYKTSKILAENLAAELSAKHPNQRFEAIFWDTYPPPLTWPSPLAQGGIEGGFVEEIPLKLRGGTAQAGGDMLGGVVNIDVLINNAGAALYKLFTDCSPEEISACIQNNLTGAVLTCRRILPQMLKNGGSIINISSIWGVRGGAMEAVYSAAKAGLHGLTYALAKEYASAGITVNAIAPGLILGTDMAEMFSEADLVGVKNSTPAGRLGTVQDVAKTAVFLAKNRFITGNIITVDGGFTL